MVDTKMTTDRKLLELAAKAAGYVPATQDSGSPFVIFEEDDARDWNPLTDDGDALRLAVKLGMLIDQYNGVANAYASHGADMFESHHEDPCTATRLAIVRAAAEIGKAML